jgi:hypothetical protein
MLPSKWFTLAIGLPQIVDFLPPVSSPRQARDDWGKLGSCRLSWQWIIGKTWENIGQNIGENMGISINGGSPKWMVNGKIRRVPPF